jgi:RHS repeat-associated protein
VTVSENRLVSAPGGTTLAYDPLGRLYSLNDGTTTRLFLYDGDHLFGEYATNGAPLMFYENAAGVDEPVMWFNYSTFEFGTFHGDERGSVVASVASGATTTLNRYDDYGNPQGGAIAGRFGYTGQIWLPQAGLYHYRARAYNPALGRFMQTDPIGYEGRGGSTRSRGEFPMLPSALSDDIEKMVGTAPSLLKRTHGSCFFLELGALTVKGLGKALHGDWSLLVELPNWRFTKQGNMIVGSDDDPDAIDKAFSCIDIGPLTSFSIEPVFHDLRMGFGDGTRFETFLSSSEPESLTSLWVLYVRGRGSWTRGDEGDLSFEGSAE